MVDTNSNPKTVDFPIPANDDATKSISIILDAICGSIKEGLEERKTKGADKDEEAEVVVEKKAAKPAAKAEAVVEEAPAVEAPVAEAPASEENND
jgi:small subunit ribosomal protein S2